MQSLQLGLSCCGQTIKTTKDYETNETLGGIK